MTTLHDCGGVLGWPLDTFFGLSQFHGHGSWLVCEVALGQEGAAAAPQCIELVCCFAVGFLICEVLSFTVLIYSTKALWGSLSLGNR